MANESGFKQSDLTLSDRGSIPSKSDHGHRRNLSSNSVQTRVKEEASRIVADQLSAKKALLDPGTESGLLKLPNLYGAFDNVANHPRSLSNRPEIAEEPRSSIDSSIVKLSGSIPAAASRASDGASTATSKSDAVVENQDSSPVDVPFGSKLAGSTTPPTTSRTSDRALRITGNPSAVSHQALGEPSDHRPIVPVVSAHGVQSRPGTSPENGMTPEVVPQSMASVSPRHELIDHLNPSPAHEPTGYSGDGLPGGPAALSEASGSGGLQPASRQSGTTPTTRLSPIDLPRETTRSQKSLESQRPAEEQGQVPGKTPSAMSFRQSSASQTPVAASQNLVRNPLSPEFRSFSMANPAPHETMAAAGDEGSTQRGARDEGFGAVLAAQDSSSLDLSKTNELLQQLVDVVRKQASSSLPISGPSMYPDR